MRLCRRHRRLYIYPHVFSFGLFIWPTILLQSWLVWTQFVTVNAPGAEPERVAALIKKAWSLFAHFCAKRAAEKKYIKDTHLDAFVLFLGNDLGKSGFCSNRNERKKTPFIFSPLSLSAMGPFYLMWKNTF